MSPRLTSGSRLGAFEILGPLGSGGMGEVYRARDNRLDRSVAIKVLSSTMAGDPRGRERFEREARAISRLTHPHICTLYDIGTAPIDGADAQFLVMELLDGETLAIRLLRGPLPVPQALRFAIEIAVALAAAHALGIVHRDLKPANIMLTTSGVKLLDFGLARLRRHAAGQQPESALTESALTVEGLVLGTLPFMSPEQVRGQEVDARTDVFAFGAVLYEMLTGRGAFAAATQAEIVAAILGREPPPPSTRQPLASPALDRLVSTCLAKDPTERWQHAQDVALALRGIVTDASERERDRAASGDRAAEPGRSQSRDRRWRVHVAWAAAVLVVVLALWPLRQAARDALPAANARPVVVLMDSPLPGRVYDPRTFAAGGTNADDVSDALRDLALTTYKENTSPMWHREDQVRQQNPDLVISHLSGLHDARVARDDKAIADHLFDLAQGRLMLVFAYLAADNPRTRFLVYTRERFPTPQDEDRWVADVVARFPRLKNRLFTLVVPGGNTKATFRDAATAQLLRSRVKEILALP